MTSIHGNRVERLQPRQWIPAAGISQVCLDSVLDRDSWFPMLTGVISSAASRGATRGCAEVGAAKTGLDGISGVGRLG